MPAGHLLPAAGHLIFSSVAAAMPKKRSANRGSGGGQAGKSGGGGGGGDVVQAALTAKIAQLQQDDAEDVAAMCAKLTETAKGLLKPDSTRDPGELDAQVLPSKDLRATCSPARRSFRCHSAVSSKLSRHRVPPPTGAWR